MRQLLLLTQNAQALSSPPSDPATLAPELFQERETTPQTDLYMLGQIFYYLLTGGHPFVGLSLKEALNKHVTHELPLLNQCNPKISKRIAKWVDLLTQPNPENRPLSALAALHELEEITKSSNNTIAPKNTSNKSPKTNNQRRKSILILASIIAIIFITGFVIIQNSTEITEDTLSGKILSISPHLQGSLEGGTLSSTTKYCCIGTNNSSKKRSMGNEEI